MDYGKKYSVSTQWGSFLLDEGAYRDYLQGKLWISWTPDRNRNTEKPKVLDAPPDVTAAAIALRERAKHAGAGELCDAQGLKKPDAPYRDYMAGIGIEEMNLTVRAYNGLMRAGAATLGALFALITSEEGLKKVRNIGAKSIKEIEEAFFQETYNRLTNYEKAEFWQTLLNEENK